MCGIFGVVRPRAAAQGAGKSVAAMASALVHRGPDGGGFLSWSVPGAPAHLGAGALEDSAARVVLGHRRLAILDLSDHAAQPMVSASGRFATVFNGEIYNYRELRSRVAAETWRSSGDTEVLLELFAQQGLTCVRELVGMYAFAVVDMQESTLTLVRDPFGIKPLYFAQDAATGELAFASEIKALLAMPWLRRRVEPNRLYRYLSEGVSDFGDATLLRDVRQVPAGGWLRVDLDRGARIEHGRHFELRTERPLRVSDIGFDEAARAVREQFLRNVELHLRSDVPVGACLSGGIDSSAIVTAMREIGGPSLDLRTFSYVADDPSLSERPFMDLVGRASRAQMFTISPDPSELRDQLERLIDAQDEPVGSTSIYAQYRVFELAARQGVKVVLDGQGADEILAGYAEYAPARMLSYLRRGRPDLALRFILRAPHVSRKPWMTAIAVRELLSVMPDSAVHTLRALLGSPACPRGVDARWFEARGVEPHMPRRSRAPDTLRQELVQTLQHGSLPMLLRYEDRNSMAFSVESRVPFLTPGFVQFLLSLPEDYLLDESGTSKRVFRAAVRGMVPDAVLDRRDKIGFRTPELHWLRDLRPWVDGVLTSPVAQDLPFFDQPKLQDEWRKLRDGQIPFDHRVWRFINVVRWFELRSIEV